VFDFEKPNIEIAEISEDKKYGRFVVEPLERGYGTTLGNSLRRILLSSLPGTAVTSIKIAGVQHEFTTIPGVKEDVTDIVLNVKQLICKLHSEGVKTVFIEAVGPCEVTAGDIKSDGEVEVLNPDLHIATLGSGASLNMEITLNHGRGYVPADRNKTPQTVIGVIPVDSVYTPVKKVNYTVENTRVKDLTDDEVRKISAVIAETQMVEGDLRREIAMNIKRLQEIGCYRGIRHRKSLPVRGQKTKTNARTRKGPRKTVANKKK